MSARTNFFYLVSSACYGIVSSTMPRKKTVPPKTMLLRSRRPASEEDAPTPVAKKKSSKKQGGTTVQYVRNPTRSAPRKGTKQHTRKEMRRSKVSLKIHELF